MTQAIFVAPIGIGAGSSSVCLGLKHKADQRGIDLGLFVPVQQRSTIMSNFQAVTPVMSARELRQYMMKNALDELLERFVQAFEESLSDREYVVVLGLTVDEQVPFAEKINAALARALNASVLLVATDTGKDALMLNSRLEIAREAYSQKGGNLLGCVVNKAGAPRDMHGNIRPELFKAEHSSIPSEKHLLALPVFKSKTFKLFGVIPWSNRLIAPRVMDIEFALPIDWLSRGDAEVRRVEQITIGTRLAENLASVMYAGTLIVTGGDRLDVIHAAALAELSGIRLAGVLLTGGFVPKKSAFTLLQKALESGLPLMSCTQDTYPAATRLSYLYGYIAKDDHERYQEVLTHFSEHIHDDKLKPLLRSHGQRRLTPAAFRYNLIKVAKAHPKTIVLPEGDEPRTISAAIACMEKNIAKCILLAEPEKVKTLATSQGLNLPDGLTIIQPETIAERYVQPFVALRRHKGMNEVRARQLLEDTVVLGTMMLQQGEVDGLVSGAVHTTANTILPALQLIKTKPSTQLVSSLFFMCLPEQVVAYADCAVNPDPTADELADIAIATADSAKAFGLEPRVAMISYSTGSSGRGQDVDKVVQATALAKQLRPDLVIDGPLQYDAAVIQKVADSKAPDSPVAGKANVFIFPDLNTGNTTYKAVQRSADVVSIGPMLQGLKKPVNDLSRGALVDDIIYTIALTAIQAIE